MGVEFLGLPGSGKSTLSRRVAVILARDGVPVRQTSYAIAHGQRRVLRRIAKMLLVGGEILSHPRYAERSARALRATGQRSGRAALKMLFNWLLVSALVRRSRRIPAIHLIDQGIHQALWSIGLDAGEGAVAAMACLLADRPPEPDVIVVVEAATHTIARRLRERGGSDSRADAWQPQDARDLHRAERLLDEVKARLADGPERRRQASVIGVDNDRDGDLERNARQLAEAIARFVGETA